MTFGALLEIIVNNLRTKGMTKNRQFHKILKQNPWPKTYSKQDVFEHGWMSDENKENLTGLLRGIKNPLVIEIGTWLGMSAKFMLGIREDLHLITIDTFLGSKEIIENPEWKLILDSGLKEQAIRNLWDYRKRCCVIERPSQIALTSLSMNNIKPDLIYIDGSHEYADVSIDLSYSLDFFDKAVVCGDDANWPGVYRAVNEIEDSPGNQCIYTDGSFWEVIRW